MAIMSRAQEQFKPTPLDVLIIGAGLSGIGAARALTDQCPDKRYLILERRNAIGGTWDLFRYPGIRSDSDMYTLSYSYKPWTHRKAIADGPDIKQYIEDIAEESGIGHNIRFQRKVTQASWSSADALWTVTALATDAQGIEHEEQFQARLLSVCAGYYSYDEGYRPDFPNEQAFTGQMIHPQFWPAELDYAGKRVVVIGSGATAVTLVPAMAKTAAHVTMLQRSPSYVVSRPLEDGIAQGLQKWLPMPLAHRMTRWKNVLLGMAFFRYCRSKPEKAKKLILRGVREQLGPDFDIGKHFTPKYNPWDQRLCLVPNGDLFDALKDGSASVVTDHIDCFTENGIRLESGHELEADLIVTATGLNLKVLGGLNISVDGRTVDLSETMTYKGMMYADVPNLASAFGYTNASWTLKCDLTCEYVCRILNRMDETGDRQATPRLTDPTVREVPWLDFSSGYVQRSLDKFPKQGSKKPWKLHQNYALDIVALKFGQVDDGVMEFSRPAPARLAS